MTRFLSFGALFLPKYTQIGFIEPRRDCQAQHHQLRERASHLPIPRQRNQEDEATHAIRAPEPLRLLRMRSGHAL